jgi:hypothetical protein
MSVGDGDDHQVRIAVAIIVVLIGNAARGDAVCSAQKWRAVRDALVTHCHAEADAAGCNVVLHYEKEVGFCQEGEPECHKWPECRREGRDRYVMDVSTCWAIRVRLGTDGKLREWLGARFECE